MLNCKCEKKIYNIVPEVGGVKKVCVKCGGLVVDSETVQNDFPFLARRNAYGLKTISLPAGSLLVLGATP